MKKTDTLSSLFGLTHNQMALLLNISRAQWSMYESGKRGIPLESRQFLAQMMGYLYLEEKGVKVRQQLIEQQEAKKKKLEKQLRRNEYELYEIDKQVELISARCNGSLAAIGFVEYLFQLPDPKMALDAELLDAISSDAGRALQKSGLAELSVLLVEKEILELKKILLGSSLNNAVKTLEKIRGEQLSYN